jgi:5-methylcytosine-specific restriction endonuclease McrA
MAGKTVKGTCKYKGCDKCTPEQCPGPRACVPYRQAYERIRNPGRHKTEARQEYVKKYNDKPENRLRHMVTVSLNRHKQLGMEVIVTAAEALALLKSTTHCRYCGKELIKGAKGRSRFHASLDRIDNGTVLTLDNIQFVCWECNTTKAARSHTEFIAYMKRALELNQ